MRADPPEGHRSRPFGCAPESACHVVLWDERRDRLQEIKKILDIGGFQQAVIEKSSDSRLIQLSAKCFVAVASTGDSASGIGRDAIKNLKAKASKSSRTRMAPTPGQSERNA